MSAIQTFGVVGLLILGSASLHAATLEEIEKDLTAKYDGISSITYDFSVTSDTAGQGYSVKSVGSGKGEMLHKDGKWFMHKDMQNKTVKNVNGAETTRETTALTVCDGEFIYNLTDTAGQKMGTKSKADTWTKHAGGKGLFETLRESYTLTVQPDESIDGRSAYVLDARSKLTTQTVITRYYFDKETGIPIKTVTKTTDDKPISEMTVTNLKQNASIPDDHFVFTAPAGVKMRDLSQK